MYTHIVSFLNNTNLIAVSFVLSSSERMIQIKSKYPIFPGCMCMYACISCMQYNIM